MGDRLSVTLSLGAVSRGRRKWAPGGRRCRAQAQEHACVLRSGLLSIIVLCTIVARYEAHTDSVGGVSPMSGLWDSDTALFFLFYFLFLLFFFSVYT